MTDTHFAQDPFGHHHTTIGGAHIDSWGLGPLLLRYHGREWWFEFSHMFGPQLLRKTDFEPAAGQPTSDEHPFWPAFRAWQRAGMKMRPVKTKRGVLRFYLCHADRGEILE